MKRAKKEPIIRAVVLRVVGGLSLVALTLVGAPLVALLVLVLSLVLGVFLGALILVAPRRKLVVKFKKGPTQPKSSGTPKTSSTAQLPGSTSKPGTTS